MSLPAQRAFLFLALFLPLALILGRAVADISLCLVGIGFLVHSWRVKDFSWLRRPWVRAALLTWVWLLVSAAFSLYSVPAGMSRGLEWGRFPLFAIAFSHWLLPLDPDYRWTRVSLWAVLGLTCLDALVQFATGTSLTGHPTAAYAQRLTGPFKDPAVGVYLCRLAWPAIGLAFFAAARHQTQIKRLALPCALALLLGFTVLLSGERIMACLFVLCAALFWLGAKKLRLPLFALGGAAAIIMTLLLCYQPRLHDRFVTSTAPLLENFDKSTYGVIFDNAITAWKLAPITGVGPKNFYDICMAKGEQAGFESASPWEPTFNCARHPHNIYLEWLAETGVIGLALFVGLVSIWLRDAVIRLRATPLPQYYMALGFAVGLVAFLWPFMSSMSFFINWSAVLFWWVLGLNYSAQDKRA